MVNAIEKELKKDHKKVKTLLKELKKAIKEESDERESIFAELKQELIAHAKAEEMTFYTRLYEDDKTEDIAREAKEEHAIIENLLNEMEEMEVDREEWKAKFTVLKEMVEHHVADEEGEMFEKSERILDEEEPETLKEEFLEQKEEILSS